MTDPEYKSYFDVEIEKEEEDDGGKGGFFARLKKGLGKTRKSIAVGLDAAFGDYEVFDDDFYDELEEVMISSDVGVNMTEEILSDLRWKVNNDRIKDPEECRSLLRAVIRAHMKAGEADYRFEREKSVILMIGVNGTGKTTTCGKLAALLKNQGRKVLLCAADTFRAAASDQLRIWADRAGVQIIAGKEGSDPAAVVYDAVAAAKARDADVLICDTAGRLHNRKNLMAELHKIRTIIGKEYPEAYIETLVVLDGATGQNALSQAKEFASSVDMTGIVLTKLDGTAKGGIAIAIQHEMQVPVKYVGVGEGIEDLQKFDAGAYADALFS